jgi:hypothetical protein
MIFGTPLTDIVYTNGWAGVEAKMAVWGSFNFTKAAEENNGENLRVPQDASCAAKHAENWQKIGSIRNRIRDGLISLAGPQPYAP